ncbi:hypothetical protein GZH47_29670 [Paenibacillus rhizovicinus]|uniref:Uncharacterized protein n=1 Tax=Paenibacillus rhizovicinus TaxID=2704463 RepID=A0A6C0PA91_9BACL|nr:hypothetical protein [Paenibacillus rhizovicinus]QHW34553.1 hypothetical protein GZH47_29670 [Paenibacillus rhizovicinus]
MNNTSVDDYFAQLRDLKPGSDSDADHFGEALRSAGFTPMRRFLDEFRLYLRSYLEAESGAASELLKRAMKAVPEPGRISPSWTYVWREYEGIIRTKAQVFRDIPESEREGEWQVLLDNPFSNQNIAVYPNLTFIEAAYMFAYFRTDLTNSEYVRLQKIATLMTFSGADSDGIQPIVSL